MSIKNTQNSQKIKKTFFDNSLIIKNFLKHKIFLFGVGLTNEIEEKVLEYILISLEKTTKKYYIVTPNPEILVFAKKHKDFMTVLNNAEIALVDGMGIVWASKLLGKRIKQKITGADFMQRLCQEALKKPINVGFLGGGPGIAERTAECLQKKYPGLKVVFAGSEWPGASISVGSGYCQSFSSRQCSSESHPAFAGVKRLRAVGRPSNSATPHFISSPRHKDIDTLSIDLLFVAFGFPKQEEWIAQNLDKIPVRIAMGVGGAFDYISGNTPRAPVLIRKLGFEWLYRLINQPWRWKRQLALIEFGYLVIKERFKNDQFLMSNF